MHDSERLNYTLISYIFWSLLIIYTNPGGIIEAFNVSDIWGKVDMKDLLFALMSICFLFIPKSNNILDIEYRKILIFLVLFMLYYLIFHVIIVPLLNGISSYSVINSIIKSRHNIYYLLFFIYIYEFFKQRVDIFIKIYAYSSVTIIILFILQLPFNIKILPVYLLDRSFIEIKRNIMMSEGILLLLIPMGVIIIVYNLKIYYRGIIVLGFTLLPLYYIISLRRMELISIVIYLLIAIISNILITKEYKLLLTRGIKTIALLMIIISLSHFIFPQYTEAAGSSLIESYNVIRYGKTSNGEKDERLQLSKPFIVSQFLKHPIFGTGFDNRWKNSSGQKQGYESSDYPLLTGFARYGLVGIVIFTPIYFVIFKILKKDIKHFQRNTMLKPNLSYLFMLTFMLYFMYHFLQYFNWYCAVSSNVFYYWYIFLAFYLAARYRYYLQNTILMKKLK